MSEAALPRAIPAAAAPRGRLWHGGMRRLLRGRRLRLFLAAQFVALAIVVARDAGWLQMAELAAYDALVTLDAGHATGDRIVLVTATDQDIARFGWPLRDADLSAVLDRLMRWQARVVGVDLYRDQPLAPGSDALDAALRRNPDILWVYKLPDEANDGVAPPAALAGTPRAVLADVVTDAGGVVRRGLLAASDPRTGRNARALGLALAERMTGAGIRRLDRDVALGGMRIPLVQERGGPYADVDAGGYQTLLDFRGGDRRFRRFSIGDILDGDDVPAAAIAGRAVIVGTDALSVRDSFATPFSNAWGGAAPLSGAALHAQLADQLVRIQRGESVGRVATPWRIDTALIWGCAMAGALLSASLASARLSVLAGGLGMVAIAGIDAGTFAAGWILPGVPCALAFLGSAGLANAALYAATHRERRHIESAFAHYLDPRIIREIVAADELPKLSGEDREISVLFTDVAGFTTLSETLPAPVLASLMTAYFDGVCAAAIGEGGLVSSFAGDGMLCLFGAPQAQPDHPARAVRAALAIDAAAEAFAQARRAAGIAFGTTRIGVHTGRAVVGNIGTSSRLIYGALGDTLNTGARIEGLNRRIGTRICVSEATASRCPGVRFQTVGAFVVKGRSNVTAVATPVRAETDWLDRYDAAYRALREGADEAADLFAELVAVAPNDPCVAFHARRLAAGERGIHLVMDEK